LEVDIVKETFDTHNLLALMLSVGLAIFGSLARMLSTKEKEVRRIRDLLSRLFVTTFAGLLVGLICLAMHFGAMWAAIAGAIAGWLGTQSIDLIIAIGKKKLGVEEKKDEQSD
jgi:NO-binding membrane sensor protein with MHYT domain